MHIFSRITLIVWWRFAYTVVNPSIENMYTVTHSVNGSCSRQFAAEDPCLAEEERTLREQDEILQLDDIVEQVSDDPF